MRGHPVQEHPDPRLVEAVDQVPEVVGGAEPGGGRVIGGDLVAPRAAERVLRDRQEFHVREPQLADVVHELVGKLPVGQAGPPRTEVHLVDAHRLAVQVSGGALRQPLVVLPGVAGGEHHGRGLWRRLGGERHRVGFLPPHSVGAEHLVLVPGTVADPGDEQLPHPAGAERTHGVPSAVPVVEVPNHPYPAGVGRPHGERGPFRVAQDRREAFGVRAEHAPQFFVPPFLDEVDVELSESGQVPVGVVHGELGAVVVAHHQPVVGDFGTRNHPGEHAFVQVGKFDPAAVGEEHVHGAGERAQGTHPHPFRAGMRAEQGVRVVVGASDQGVDFSEECVGHRISVPVAGLRAGQASGLADCRPGGHPVSAVIESSGILIQCGRWRASYRTS